MKYTNDQLDLLLKQAIVHKSLELTEEVLRYVDPSDKLFMKASIIKGEILMSEGDYEKGLPLYRYEYDLWDHKMNMPMWNGEDEIDVLVLWQDQGFGDTIQNIRYFEMLLAKARITRLYILVKKELQELFHQTFPAFCGKIAVEGDGNLFDIDLTATDRYMHLPISQLPLLFKTTIDTIPHRIPYLKADKLEIPHKIGWCWESGNQWSNAHFKSIPQIWIEPLMEKFGGISLQVKDLNVDNFAATATIINSLDLIISVDTATAHLAGALGKPVWILLHQIADWRWMKDRTDNLWYPTARLFRQKAFGDWKSVLAEVESELDQ